MIHMDGGCKGVEFLCVVDVRTIYSRLSYPYNVRLNPHILIKKTDAPWKEMRRKSAQPPIQSQLSAKTSALPPSCVPSPLFTF